MKFMHDIHLSLQKANGQHCRRGRWDRLLQTVLGGRDILTKTEVIMGGISRIRRDIYDAPFADEKQPIGGKWGLKGCE